MNGPSDAVPDEAAAAPTPQQIAEAVRDALWSGDAATRLLGARVVAVGPGHSLLSLAVRAEMLNGHAICHGGFVTTLADSALAYAANSFNELTVSSGFDVNFVASARQGDLLYAEARSSGRGGRTGIVDVVVRNQHGETVALLRGRSYTMKGKPVVAGWPIGRAAG